MASHLDVAVVPTEEKICNAIMNPQTIYHAVTDDEKEKSKESP
jgi:hypothetical protein